jgi:hypothetical protein
VPPCVLVTGEGGPGSGTLPEGAALFDLSLNVRSRATARKHDGNVSAWELGVLRGDLLSFIGLWSLILPTGR